MIILGLLMTMLVAVITPLIRSQSRSQAKLDTVQSAAAALYRIQRDLRQTYYVGTWACTTGSSASCSQPTTFGTTSAIAFPTAYQNGTGQFQLQTGVSTPGQPNWQGVMVYWIDSAGALHWAFDPKPTGFTDEHVNSTTAAKAVVDATTGVVTSTAIAANVKQLAVAINLTKPNIISLQMQAQSTENGSVNKTTYRSDVLGRNN
ncbi:MAG: hypothetical protein M3007_05620 [Candidatus Eremiobacteraeota bacterium]|nr:hypothetical protein [Candidatus Eremiobacteraeota bacterium]